MEKTNTRRRIDGAIACALAVIALFFSVLNVERSCDWGDDFAGYILEGMAIADGRFEEQTELNLLLHPTSLPEEAGSRLVYAWGYPLLLSAVYRAVGFDRDTYTSLLYYRIPTYLCFALLAAVLYLFYRRRFSRVFAALLTLLFCLHPEMLEAQNTLYSDIVYLFWCMLSLYAGELFLAALAEDARPRRRVLTALLCGVALWMAYETRLNGFTVCLAVLLMHAVQAVRHRGFLKKHRLTQLLPYAVLLGLALLFDRVLLAPATSNLSDYSQFTVQTLLSNIRDYFLWVGYWLHTLALRFAPGTAVLSVLLVLGFVLALKKELPLAVFAGGTFLALFALPYTQGLRYFYSALPLLLLFIGLGAQFLWGLLKKRASANLTRRSAAVLYALAVFLAAAAVKNAASDNLFLLLEGRLEPEAETAYSAAAVDVYHYIQDSTPEESVISFVKPRALYLNTGRESFCPLVNGHRYEMADYALVCLVNENYDHERSVREKSDCRFESVYSNAEFVLYRVIRPASASAPAGTGRAAQRLCS